MPRYRILDVCWLDFKDGGPRLVLPFTEVTLPNGKTDQVETVIDYDGWPNSAMEPLDDSGKELADVVARLRGTQQLPRSPKEWRESERASRARRERPPSAA